MTALGAIEGYRLWAPSYSAETAVSLLENELVTELTPPLIGLRLVDAGCGTGRRLRAAGAASAVGVDISPEMIGAGECVSPAPDAQMIVGDIRALPVPDRAFDVVWCRLAIGHVADCDRVYADLARVADRGATIIVSDFHPDAYRAGHRRTFRHDGAVVEIEHHVHDVETHLAAAREAGLELLAIREAAVGPSVRRFYESAGRSALYHAHLGLPVVLAFSFRRGR